MTGVKLAGIFKENGKAIANLIQGWNYFLHTEVVVGIPEETNSGRGSINNAELLYLHENGVPSRNIPARPVLKQAINDAQVKQQIEKMMKDGAKSALVHGDRAKAEQCFHKAGMVASAACKKYITSGANLAPNAPATVAQKGSSKPLIDTGSMLNSINYAVRRK